MKSQMKFQKILCLLTLIIGALAFVYACSFMTGDLAALYKWQSSKSALAKPSQLGPDPIGADGVYAAASSTNGTLVVLAIVLIVASVFLFITSSNKRRNYYITNYVAIIGCATVYTVLAIVCIALISSVLAQFEGSIKWDVYWEYSQIKSSSGAARYGEYSRNYVMFILGYIMYAVVILNAAALILNLIWKIKLMKGEKALLAQGLVKEVA